MGAIVMLCVLLVACIVAAPAAAEETGTLNAKVVLRKAPDEDSKALQTLPKGDEVVLLNTSGRWYKVSYGSFTGYVMKKFVKVSKNSVVANESKIADLGDAPGALRIGYNGKDVTKLQKALDILGYYDGRIDGDYGEGTTAAVLKYQQEKGLEADGVAGRDTIISIFGSCAKSTQADTGEKETTAATSNNTSPKKTTASNTNSVSSFDDIGKAPSPTKPGDSGTNVKKLQQALTLLGYYSSTIDSNYGDQTVYAVKKFQRNRGMKQDGVAGESTIRVMFSGTESESTATASSSSSSSSGGKKTELLDWYEDNVTKVIPKNAKIVIKDIRTGKTFTAVRWSGANHIDAEPATASDTKIMKGIYGGSWSWDRRAILVQYNGHVYAASMNGMPHGDSTIHNNNFDGVFCIHFKNSKTHGSDKVDPDHQKAINSASKSNW